MSEAIRAQVLLNYENYSFLREESIGRKHKSISVTLNELLRNYQYMIRAAKREQEKRERAEKEKEQAVSAIGLYREQVLKNAKILKEH